MSVIIRYCTTTSILEPYFEARNPHNRSGMSDWLTPAGASPRLLFPAELGWRQLGWHPAETQPVDQPPRKVRCRKLCQHRGMNHDPYILSQWSLIAGGPQANVLGDQQRFRWHPLPTALQPYWSHSFYGIHMSVSYLCPCCWQRCTPADSRDVLPIELD
jgi:hypothetical protein